MKRTLMICGLAIVLVLSVYLNSFAGGLGGTFSHGYRMGQLSFTVRGFIKSGEGQLLLGRESSPYTKGVGEDSVRINPWYFSAEENNWLKLDGLIGQYVIIEYEQSRAANTLIQETDYTALDAYPVTRNYPKKRSCEIVKPFGVNIHSEGAYPGRLVKVAEKGNVAKTYEALVQVGNAGNQFKHMSINDDKMFEYAVEVLKSGKSAVIHYVELRANISMRDTDYVIWKISFPDDI